MMKTIKLRLFFLTFIISSIIYSQKNQTTDNVFVDKKGVMRWQKTNDEVKGFGVNYSVPFAHAYRSAKRLNIDVKKAIDNDVYHFTRLGFDLYRLHVWDTEISDTLGNLINNQHLETFDYLLKKLKDNNINYVITPIAFWGNGWPEPDSNSPGFSNKYGKGKSLTNPDAIKAQQNYLYQFLNHINPYTEVAYKNEPNVIAFEVSNEPHHSGDAKKVTEFVESMVNSMRKTGTKKPIFYNISHGVHFVDAYFEAGINGGTFQWYPTGLGYGQELSGNMLPNVNDYNIPFNEQIKKHKGAKLVYEFDAADIGKSYIYPAMARSFRTAGIQIGTHFAYDPTYMAYANTEYNTHYMNLVYTPQKALSLKISGEVFREVPMYKQFGKYPLNKTFDNFTIDYENDLALYNSNEKFYYTNSTNSIPKNQASLKEIAGSKNSSVIKYDGCGAYFLDKIDAGIWRLEVLPDAVWVDDPFGRNSPKKTVAVIKWDEHNMTINLNDLGENFKIEAINDGENYKTSTNNKTFIIKPGTYIVGKNGAAKNWKKTDAFKTHKLNDFFAPKTTVDKTWYTHNAKVEVSENLEIELSAQIVSNKKIKEVTVFGYNSYNQYFNVKMELKNPYNYVAKISSEYVKQGFINYNIVLKTVDEEQITYPSGKEGNLYDWDFYAREPYKIAVVANTNPIYLFDAITDADFLVKQWKRTFKLVPTDKKNEAEYQMSLDQLFSPDNENLNAIPIYDYSFKHFVSKQFNERKIDLKDKKELVFYGRSLQNKPVKLQIALVLKDGSSFGKVIEINSKMDTYKISLSDLNPVKTVTLPRPYPSFLPYFFEHENNSTFNIMKVESVQFSIGPELTKKEQLGEHGLGFVKLWLE
ncbi:MAG: hypothetical protein WAO74_04355 [Polaribacter sp.]|uniref:hypothetical protein n=1 Tax=Polaribacter sp. TaxID=1920175 RepID=UPI003BB0CCB9